MSKDGTLPPGVEHWGVPGDRPDDVRWDAAMDRISAEMMDWPLDEVERVVDELFKTGPTLKLFVVDGSFVKRLGDLSPGNYRLVRLPRGV